MFDKNLFDCNLKNLAQQPPQKSKQNLIRMLSKHPPVPDNYICETCKSIGMHWNFNCDQLEDNRYQDIDYAFLEQLSSQQMNVLLVDGYIREQEQLLDLSNIIAASICSVILSFYELSSYTKVFKVKNTLVVITSEVQILIKTSVTNT